MSESWDDAPVAIGAPAQDQLEVKLFARWSSSDVQVSDISLTVSFEPKKHKQNTPL